MFDSRLIPENVLYITMRDLKSVILRVNDSGFPRKSIPPHACAILISTEKMEDGSEDYVLSRSMPVALDSVENSLWVPDTFFMFENVYKKLNDDSMVAIFIGFVDEYAKYVGLLLSKDAQDSVCALTNLDASKDIQKLGHPFEKYPFLFEVSYHSQGGQEEAH